MKTVTNVLDTVFRPPSCWQPVPLFHKYVFILLSLFVFILVFILLFRSITDKTSHTPGLGHAILYLFTATFDYLRLPEGAACQSPALATPITIVSCNHQARFVVSPLEARVVSVLSVIINKITGSFVHINSARLRSTLCQYLTAS